MSALPSQVPLCHTAYNRPVRRPLRRRSGVRRGNDVTVERTALVRQPPAATTRLRLAPWKPIVVGLVAGLLSGIFGVGGGILIVPGLVLALGMQQRLAHGTSLAAIIPIAAAGLSGYAVAGEVDWLAALLL